LAKARSVRASGQDQYRQKEEGVVFHGFQ
jgi:hypothetical protein